MWHASRLCLLAIVTWGKQRGGVFCCRGPAENQIACILDIQKVSELLFLLPIPSLASSNTTH